MGYKLGDDVMVWVDVASTYTLLDGQGDLEMPQSRNVISVAAKNDYPGQINIGGSIERSLSLSCMIRLPDTAFGALQTAFASAAPIGIHVRDAGLTAGALDTWIEGEFMVSKLDTGAAKDGVVTVSIEMVPAGDGVTKWTIA